MTLPGPTTESQRIEDLLRSFPSIPQSRQWSGTLHRVIPAAISGRVRSIRGTTIVVDGLPVPVGSVVRIERQGDSPLEGDVIGFDSGRTLSLRWTTWTASAQGNVSNCIARFAPCR